MRLHGVAPEYLPIIATGHKSSPQKAVLYCDTAWSVLLATRFIAMCSGNVETSASLGQLVSECGLWMHALDLCSVCVRKCMHAYEV